MAIIKTRKNMIWNTFVIVFSLLWICWCLYFIENFHELSIKMKIINSIGIAILSPDIQSIYRLISKK